MREVYVFRKRYGSAQKGLQEGIRCRSRWMKSGIWFVKFFTQNNPGNFIVTMFDQKIGSSTNSLTPCFFGGNMTSKDILALMECKRKYMLRNLSLKGQNERGVCFQKALRPLILIFTHSLDHIRMFLPKLHIII